MNSETRIFSLFCVFSCMQNKMVGNVDKKKYNHSFKYGKHHSQINAAMFG